MVPPAHEWSERGFVEPAELKQERMIMRERGSGTRRVVEMALQKAGVRAKQLKLAMEFDSTEGIMTAVEAGLGIGFASLWSISKALQLGSLRVVPIHDVRITRPLPGRVRAWPGAARNYAGLSPLSPFPPCRHEPNNIKNPLDHYSSNLIICIKVFQTRSTRSLSQPLPRDKPPV